MSVWGIGYDNGDSLSIDKTTKLLTGLCNMCKRQGTLYFLVEAANQTYYHACKSCFRANDYQQKFPFSQGKCCQCGETAHPTFSETAVSLEFMRLRLYCSPLCRHSANAKEAKMEPQKPKSEAFCMNCSLHGTIVVGKKRCGKCKLIRYCSRECQKMDWPRHRKTCIPCWSSHEEAKQVSQ